MASTTTNLSSLQGMATLLDGTECAMIQTERRKQHLLMIERLGSWEASEVMRTREARFDHYQMMRLDGSEGCCHYHNRLGRPEECVREHRQRVNETGDPKAMMRFSSCETLVQEDCQQDNDGPSPGPSHHKSAGLHERVKGRDDPNAPSSAPFPKVSTIDGAATVRDSGTQGKTSEEARPETVLSTPPQHPGPDICPLLLSMILTAPPPSSLPGFLALDMEKKLDEFRDEAPRRRNRDMSLFSICREYRQIDERRMQQQMTFSSPAPTVLPVLSPLPIQSIVPAPDVEDKFKGCLAELMFAMGSPYHKWGQWNYKQCVQAAF